MAKAGFMRWSNADQTADVICLCCFETIAHAHSLDAWRKTSTPVKRGRIFCYHSPTHTRAFMGKKKPPLALALDQLFDVGGVMERTGLVSRVFALATFELR